MTDLEALRRELDAPQRGRRDAALDELLAATRSGTIERPPQRDWFNLHCHSFYSYNGYGMSPQHLVWMACELGLRMVGKIEFDVLDGVDEFMAAAARADVKAIAGLETRTVVPPFADREINSPGEPGIAYHLACGVVDEAVPPAQEPMAQRLRAAARERNLAVIERVNPVLDPVTIDYERDVLPLTPAGVATERHCCAAYDARSRALFPDADQRAAWWSERLGLPQEQLRDLVEDAARIQAAIRSKTMKRGGVGYVQPTADSFPDAPSFNAFCRGLGAIPSAAWLDGGSAGEAAVDELLDYHQSQGVHGFCIIPDRNWNFSDAAVQERKLARLDEIVTACTARHLPIFIGTELNAPGLKFVDDFDAPELAPYLDAFRFGADVLFGHTVAQRRDGRGYESEWAQQTFPDLAARNEHFADLGRRSAADA